MMTWLGVGNVQGVLMRAGSKKGNGQELLLLARPVSSAPSCLPCRPPCFPLRREIPWYLLRMEFEANLPKASPLERIPTKSRRRILKHHIAEMMTRSFWSVRLTGVRSHEDGN